MRKCFLVICFPFLLNACISLNKSEKETLYELKQYGVRDNVENVASPLLAGTLNILPGIGNFYLGTGEAADGTQWIYGILNFFTWPISPIWSIAQASTDANTINKRETVYYYQFSPKGKAELEELRQRKTPAT